MLATGSFILAAGASYGDSHEEEANGAVPVELYACKYNEGKGPADLDTATAAWNAWADDRGLNDYTAWTLTKFYAGPEQEFDVIWLQRRQPECRLTDTLGIASTAALSTLR